MHKSKEDLYSLVNDILKKDEFEKEIIGKVEEFDGLITQEAAGFLIVDKLGRNNENVYDISDLKAGIDCTVKGKIVDISKTHSFKRKNGSVGTVVNLLLSDGKADCKLVLWNKDVELVKNNKIQKGSIVKIVNGYVKENNYKELELNAGRYGLIEVENNKEEDAGAVDNFRKNDVINGKILEIQPSRAFFKDNGDFGFVTNIQIKQDEKIKNVCLWDKKVKEIQSFKPGDYIEIKNINTRNKNGKKEFHVNGQSVIKKI